MGNQHDLKRQLSPEEIQERREFVVQLRRKHVLWEHCAQKVEEKFGYKISATMCAEDFRIVMRTRNKDFKQDIDAIRELTLDQLDNAAQKLEDKIERGDIDAIDTYLKIQNRKARLLGLDAPVQREDVTKRQRLTADEIIERMAQISARLKERAKLGEAPAMLSPGNNAENPVIEAETVSARAEALAIHDEPDDDPVVIPRPVPAPRR